MSENDLLNILRKCFRHYEQTERPWHKRKVRKKYLLQFAGFGIKVVKWFFAAGLPVNYSFQREGGTKVQWLNITACMLKQTAIRANGSRAFRNFP